MKVLVLILSIFILFWCSSNKEPDVIIKEKENDEKRIILALWDSITAWYWLTLEDSYPSKLEKLINNNWYNYKVINWWVSWDTSDGLKSRASIYTHLNPDTVIIVIWWNDWLRWLPLDNLKTNILEVIDIFKNLNTNIVVSWMDIPANLWVSYRNNFRDVYKDIQKERNDIFFQDFFLEWVAWNPKLNLSDMIHPNSSWYDIISNNMYDFLEKNNLLIKD